MENRPIMYDKATSGSEITNAIKKKVKDGLQQNEILKSLNNRWATTIVVVVRSLAIVMLFYVALQPPPTILLILFPIVSGLVYRLRRGWVDWKTRRFVEEVLKRDIRDWNHYKYRFAVPERKIALDVLKYLYN